MVGNLIMKLTKLLILAGMTMKVMAIDVAEAFSFNCIHCYNIEPQVQSLRQSAKVNYIPLPIYDPKDINQLAVINAYFAAQALGKEPQFRLAYFNAVFNQGMSAYAPETLVSVLTACNLNNKAFYSLASSERITRKVQFAASLAVRYQINGTPTFIVNNNQVFEGENAIQEIAALY